MSAPPLWAVRRVLDGRRRLAAELGRPPAPAEVARASGVSRSLARAVMARATDDRAHR